MDDAGCADLPDAPNSRSVGCRPGAPWLIAETHWWPGVNGSAVAHIWGLPPGGLQDPPVRPAVLSSRGSLDDTGREAPLASRGALPGRAGGLEAGLTARPAAPSQTQVRCWVCDWWKSLHISESKIFMCSIKMVTTLTSSGS